MQVITNLNVDRKALSELFRKHKVVALEPQTVTRMARDSRGLLVHRDPELCFVVSGPENLPELLKGNNLVNDVLSSPKVRVA